MNFFIINIARGRTYDKVIIHEKANKNNEYLNEEQDER